MEINESKDNLRKNIIKKTKGELLKCFNCGTCSAGCPVSQISNFNPRKILRKIISGINLDEDISACVSCYTCNARCPNGINIPKIIDILKIEYNLKGVENRESIFNKSFLDTVEKNGRLYEVEMLLKYKLKSGNLLQDMELGLPLILKGRMGIFPHKSKNAKAAKEIFRKVREIDERD